VTVAAPVDEWAEGAWQSAGTWYLEVGVARTGEGLVAVSEPAIVPAPAEPRDAPDVEGGGLSSPSQDDEDMATTVEGFLRALMAGNGDVSRYLAPGVEILPVTPAPFSDVSLRQWAITDTGEGQVRVRLSARATSAAGVPRTVSYELGLAERAGRWEVTSLSGAPTIEAEEADDTDDPPATTTTSAPATTASDAEPAVTTTVSVVSEPGA
jgi:Conjugative transposon protein TcpC